MDVRRTQLEDWLKQFFGDAKFSIVALCGDASFRRYFRILVQASIENDKKFAPSYIAMDAPPEKEEITPFITIAQSWAQQGLTMPNIFAQNTEEGFLLLSDFGKTLYLNAILDSDEPLEKADTLYRQAFDSLIKIQRTENPIGHPLPKYDRPKLLDEMRLFTEWLLPKTLDIELDDREHADIERCFKLLVDSAMTQPHHPVHRDYHSRNLMVLEDNDEPGILDFQDAVIGPVTYDLVSLLRDCYIAWPEDKVEEWVKLYYDMSKEAKLHDGTWRSFQRWFDLMGIQRHLKAAGIFSRLNVRDNKPGYLPDIPQTLKYILQVSTKYKDMAPLHSLLETRVIPAAEALLPKREMPDTLSMVCESAEE